MSRNNYYLIAVMAVLLVGAGFLGGLEFRRTHPSGAQAPVPTASADQGQATDGSQPQLPPGHPPLDGQSSGNAPTPPPGMGLSSPGGSVTPTTDNAPLPKPADVDQGPGPNDGKPFPAAIEGLPRLKYLTGDAALAEVSKIHGREIKAASAELATYGSGQDVVIVWETASASKQEAQALLQAMLDRMGTNATFNRPDVLNMKGRAYFLTSSQGVQHVFFLRATRIYWVELRVSRDKIMGILSYIVSGF